MREWVSESVGQDLRIYMYIDLQNYVETGFISTKSIFQLCPTLRPTFLSQDGDLTKWKDKQKLKANK